MRRPGLHDSVDQMAHSTSSREKKNLRGVQSGPVVTQTKRWHTTEGKCLGVIDLVTKSFSGWEKRKVGLWEEWVMVERDEKIKTK